METRPCKRVLSTPAARAAPAVEVRSGEASFEPPFPGRGQTCPRASQKKSDTDESPVGRNRVCTSGDGAGRAPAERSGAAAGCDHPMRGRSIHEIFNPTLRRAWPRDLPGAAICVQDVDVQCVLQFTLIHAAGCALHRHTSRVIHRLELSVAARQQRFRSSSREAQEAGESRTTLTESTSKQ